MTKVQYVLNKKTGDGFLRIDGDSMMMPVWNAAGEVHNQEEQNAILERFVLCYDFCAAFPSPLLEGMISLQATQQENHRSVMELEEKSRFERTLLYNIVNADRPSVAFEKFLDDAANYLGDFNPKDDEDGTPTQDT